MTTSLTLSYVLKNRRSGQVQIAGATSASTAGGRGGRTGKWPALLQQAGTDAPHAAAVPLPRGPPHGQVGGSAGEQ
jgi:hypothetical protein